MSLAKVPEPQHRPWRIRAAAAHTFAPRLTLNDHPDILTRQKRFPHIGECDQIQVQSTYNLLLVNGFAGRTALVRKECLSCLPLKTSRTLDKGILGSRRGCSSNDSIREREALTRYQTVGTVPPSITYSAPLMEAARGEAT